MSRPGLTNTKTVSAIISVEPLSLPPGARPLTSLIRRATWCLPKCRKAPPKTLMRPLRQRGRRSRRGRKARGMCAPNISMPWRGRCKSASDFCRCWNPSTMASQSAKPAILIFRWWRGTFTTMPDGRNCSTVNFPITRHWAYAGKSSRGISRC